MPARDRFESETEWLNACFEWRDHKQAKEREHYQRQQAELQRRQKTESVLTQAMTLDGFDMHQFMALPVPEAMAEAILDSDSAPQLVHWLTTNPDECRRIASLSGVKQIKELDRLENKLKAPPPQPQKQQEAPRLPETLTQERDARGRFQPQNGPTPLSAILK